MSDMGVHSTEAWTQPASWKKNEGLEGNENQTCLQINSQVETYKLEKDEDEVFSLENQTYFHESKGKKD